MLYSYAEPEDEVYDSGYHNQPEHPCAPFVKAWHVPLWRQLYHLFLHPHIYYCIALHTRAPAVAPFYAREIHRIATLAFAYEDAITHHHGVTTLNNIEPF